MKTENIIQQKSYNFSVRIKESLLKINGSIQKPIRNS